MAQRAAVEAERGREHSAPAVSAAADPQTLPITPSTGPPAAWPIASAWPVIESTVARTLESVICSFSQIVSERVRQVRAMKTPSSAAIASRDAAGEREGEHAPTITIAVSAEQQSRRAVAAVRARSA